MSPTADPPDAEHAELAAEIVACVERTLSASSARIELRRDMEFSWPDAGRPGPRREGGLLRPVGKLAKEAGKLAGKAVWKHFLEGANPQHLTADGIIEPPARRHMIDFGSYAELYKDGTRWGGRSGRAIATLPPWPADRQIDLWWLLDALLGTTAATVEGRENLHGSACRRIAARVDLGRASPLVDGGLSVPSVERYEDLHSLPFTVWIDGEHVRRVRFSEGRKEAESTLTLDLRDFGAPTGELDWERLPTFRSPEEAGYHAGR